MKKRKIKRFSSLTNKRINPKGFHPSQIKFYLLLTPLAAFMLLPILFIVSTAFKPLDELFAYPPRFFVINPTIQNFIDLFSKMGNSGIPITRYLFNSILITDVDRVGHDPGVHDRRFCLVQEAFQTENRVVYGQYGRFDVCADRRQYPAFSDHPKNGLDR